MRKVIYGVAMIVLIIKAASAASWSPPTPDPTYGLPVPKAMKTYTSSHLPGWIWAKRVENNQNVYFRRIFKLPSVPHRAELYITCDDFFTAYLNGREIGKSVPDPKNGFVWRDVHHILVTPYLHIGTNVLAVKGTNAGAAAGLVAMLKWGKKSHLFTDSKWQYGGSPARGWRHRASPMPGWKKAVVEAKLGDDPWSDLNGWPGLAALPPYLYRLPLPPIKVQALSDSADFSDLSSLTSKNGGEITVQMPSTGASNERPSLLLNFGRELAGMVVIGTGESEGEALNGPWGGPETLRVEAEKIAFGRDTAFRFVKITFLSGPPVVHIRFIRCDMVYYPVKYQGSFDCSDPLLTRIWYVGAYTAHLCMHQDIWDAPKRDRARWMGDLQVSGETINDVFGDRFLMEQTMNRLRADVGNPPHSHINGIPGYSCAWVVGMDDFYRHIGDLAYLKRHRDDLIQMMDYFKKELNRRGLFADKRGQWCYVDWSPGFDDSHQASPYQLATTHFYMVKMLRDGAWLLDQIGDHTEAQRFRSWAQRAIQAAQNYLLDPTTDTFSNRWQENAMAIYSGTTTSAERTDIWDRVLSHLYPVNEAISPYYNYYDIWAMSQTGHTRQALDFIRWYWGGMIREGATTFWETYDPRWPKEHFHKYMGYAASLSHGWSSGPTSFLSERVLGLSPTSGGFHTVLIKPRLGGLTWAKGGVPTPHGVLHADYRMIGSRMRAYITLPPSEVATVSLPGAHRTLQVNGRRMAARIVGGRSEIVLSHKGNYLIE